MTTGAKMPQGKFCWADLGTKDAAGAKKFYEGLLGWTSQDFPAGPGTYSMLFVGDKDVCALYQAEAGMPTFWLAYVAVDSCDEMAKKAQSLGAKIFKAPFDVMDVGRMAVIEDPAGAAFALWEGRKHPSASLMNANGAMCWFELHTRDVDRAGGFYAKLFGWTLKPSPEYTEIHLGKDALGGMMTIAPEQGPNVPPHWLVYFMVDDVDARAAKAKSLGGQIVVPGMDIPKVGRFAVLRDPQGASLAVFKPLPRS